MSAGRSPVAGKKDWNTPPKYVQPIKQFFGGIDLDPCSNSTSIVEARNEFCLPEKDGLIEDWDAKTVFVNPPYGRSGGSSLYSWIKKSLIEYDKWKFEVIFLIPVATNTKHFKEIIFPQYNAICFLSDTRLRFLNNGVEDKKGAPMACCLVYKGERGEKFKEVFDEYGYTFLLRQ